MGGVVYIRLWSVVICIYSDRGGSNGWVLLGVKMLNYVGVKIISK